jgi:hypothetical protein
MKSPLLITLLALASAPLALPQAYAIEPRIEAGAVKTANFVPAAIITLADGTVHPVADFAFYTYAEGSRGSYYTPSSGTEDWSLYVKQGPIWRTYNFPDVASIQLGNVEDDNGWVSINVTLQNGSSLTGKHAQWVWDRTWQGHGAVYMLGETEIFGRKGAFECLVREISKIERIGNDPSPAKYRITHKGADSNAELRIVVSNPRFQLQWKNDTPSGLSEYALDRDMPVKVNRIEIQIKPREIESVSISPSSEGKPSFTVKMKDGNTAQIDLPPRIFGKLQSGDILFTPLLEDGRPVVTKIEIK